MASNPPFHVEDQTDEDFFDKLVEDDFEPSSVVAKVNDGGSKGFVSRSDSEDAKVFTSLGNESDEAQAFANLSIDDGDGEGGKEVGKESGVGEVGVKSAAADVEEKNSVVMSELVGVGFENKVNNDGKGVDEENVLANDGGEVVGINEGGGPEVVADSTVSKDSGSVVKEVGWNSLFADSGQNEGGDFGSDFFTGLGDNSGGFPGVMDGGVGDASGGFPGAMDWGVGDTSGEFPGVMDGGLGYNSAEFSGNLNESVIGGAQLTTGNEEHKAESLDSSVNYAQYYEGQGYSGSFDTGTEQQDLNTSQYWESLYPGWKYDLNTGQWYQVDGQDSSGNVQGSYDATTSTSEWDTSERKSEVSYFQQTAPSVTETVADSGTTESVSSWNQASQTNTDLNQNNGYPAHMIFDPQYPGWYYDTLAQEWRSLESYTSSVQSTGQTHEQQNQNDPSGNFSNYNNNLYGEFGQADNYNPQGISSQGQDGSWVGSYDNGSQHNNNMWQPDTFSKSEAVSSFGGNQQIDSSYSLNTSVNNHTGHQLSHHSFGAMPSYGNTNQTHSEANGFGYRSFVPSAEFSKPFNMPEVEQNKGTQFSNGYYDIKEPTNNNQQPFQGGQQFSFASSMERSSAGRPAHALVTFGFGGKIVIMKNNSSLGNSLYGSQDVVGSSISVLNLAEVVTDSTDATGVGAGSCSYFNALCKQSFPGPLGGGSFGTKELNKWIDERIANCESYVSDYSKGRVLKLLLSLLKIACQHYGKLRSPFGSDTTLRESDIPETAVAKLFASAKNGVQFNAYGALNHCVQNLPPEAQIRATASEVQNLLVSGRKNEALQCAQEGQLWGPALVIASQLGEQFYVDTVKQMALRQLVAGSPLRTLCLLIAGQPAEVFSTDTTGSYVSSDVSFPQQQAQCGANGMLDDWEENLAMITANRTKDDELVIIHLGDCLWKERSDIIAAHVCYIVAEANFESYSDTARLCLVGSDHWKNPRTYASPEAIQRTEVYEYSKVTGNSQFILQPFQPYKLIYAHMLAEVGRVSDSLKYCQAVLKSLKTGRAPEVESWRQLALSLEERIRAHQQGGYYTANLAPKKIVGKLLNFFDSTAHKVVGGMPPPVPSTAQGHIQGNDHYTQPMGNRVSTSQSTMAMSSLMPSASMEPISEWAADNSRKIMQNRSVSEPDFSRSPRQAPASSKEMQPSEAQGKASGPVGASRFSRFGFGSQIFQKTVGLVLRPRPGKQAKLGETNKFYYDEKLKRWVEEGAEPPAEEVALPPPPTTAAFQNGISNTNSSAMLTSEAAAPPSSSEFRSPTSADHSYGIPPIAPSSNQFSARGRMGVRARYVDTFNKGGAPAPNLFQSPSIPSVKPNAAANAKFFIPTPAAPAEQTVEATAENLQENTVATESPSVHTTNESVQTHAASPPMAMQRFPSMDNISRKGPSTSGGGSLSSHSRRTASWSGSLGDSYGPKMGGAKPLGEALGMSPLASMQSDQTSSHTPSNSGSYGDLQEVEL